MIKLWTKIKRKRRNKPNLKSSKEIKKITMIMMSLVQNKSRKNKLRWKRKRKNSDHSHIVQIIANGKRRIDFRKAIKCLLSLVGILILRGHSSKEVGCIILTRQVHSLTLSLLFRADKLIMQTLLTTSW